MSQELRTMCVHALRWWKPCRIWKGRFCALSVLALLGVPVPAQYRVAGYYPMWNKSFLPPGGINYSAVTHIFHAFDWPNADGSIASGESGVDTALINTTHRASRKIVLSLGGAGATQAANFATVAADSNLRKTFAANVVSWITSRHYDGVDLDWEGPANAADKANEVSLVKQLRAALQAADSSLLLTMAVGASPWSGQWRDYSTLEQYVDWFNAMEYDFHGSWSSLAGHNAPLYAGTDPLTDPDYYSIDLSYQYLVGTRGISKSKILLGMPFYGKSFGTSVLYTSYTGEQDLAYRDILSSVGSGVWVYTWDAGSSAPLYVSDRPARIITLDDSLSIALKCQYAKTNGLAGVMIWEITQDVVGSSQPLMDVVCSQMFGTSSIDLAPLPAAPVSYALERNFPNPFNPSTTIRFTIPISAHVTIRVFDILGREVATLLDAEKGAGSWSVLFDATSRRIASGVYYYRMDAGGFVATGKMILTR